MRTADAVGHDLKFACNECGKVATRVRVLEPGEIPGAQDDFWASLTSDARRLCVEVDGLQAWTSKRSETPEEILSNWLAEDFHALRRENNMQTANRCFDCEKWYCADHTRSERIVYGAPAYDYYFASVCSRCYQCTVER